MQAVAFVLVMAAQAPGAPQAAPPAAAPPQNPPPSRLIELPRLRPTRADNARENLALDPAERPAPQAEEAAPPEPSPEQLAPPAPVPPPPAAPTPLLAPVAPAPAPAAARVRGGTGFDPRLLAPLTALVGPVIAALWLVSRRGVGTPAE